MQGALGSGEPHRDADLPTSIRQAGQDAGCAIGGMARSGTGHQRGPVVRDQQRPGYQTGIYRDVLLRRWRNLLGRTMGDFPGGRTGGNRYLVLGLGPGPGADLAVPPDRYADIEVHSWQFGGRPS